MKSFKHFYYGQYIILCSNQTHERALNAKLYNSLNKWRYGNMKCLPNNEKMNYYKQAIRLK